ncbi:Tetratricopeptide repeat protein [Pigmentiphaga humi]|uniref:Tetratricopeptide repeat protein n=1 Tax=Pigmentiphaga humi TaxID=2478468 RepID=A0A3P4AX62_9BURK|nr:tetratricopeptide repeat protein [Pigmentiphaga humi]VCU68649.1 Tetratricopeptide repeat protein [Pigmentiphaga humi]
MTRPGFRGIAAAVLAAAGMLAAAAPCAAAASGEWQSLYERAGRHYAGGDAAAAEAAARQALRMARTAQRRSDPHVASSLNLLALARQAQGDAAQAAELLREALALSERALGAHANTAALALNLGGALEAAGRGEEAIAAYERCLAIGEALPGGADGQAARLRKNALSALSALAAGLGRPEQARAYDRRLLAEEDSTLSGRERADALARQAQALQEQGGADEAAGLHREAAALREAADPDDPALAGHYNELALWHMQRKEYGEARQRFEQALAQARKREGAARALPEAAILASMAKLAEQQGGTAQARQAYGAALDIYTGLGDADEALAGRSQILNQLAGLDYRQQRWADAERRFLEALRLLEQAAGPADPRLLPVLDNLDTYYASRGQPDKSREFARRAAELRQPVPAGSGS